MPERVGIKEKFVGLGLVTLLTLGASACAESKTQTPGEAQKDAEREQIREDYAEFRDRDIVFSYNDEGRLYTQVVAGDGLIFNTTVSECQGPTLVEVNYDGSTDRSYPFPACEDDGFLSRDEIEELIPQETITTTSVPR